MSNKVKQAIDHARGTYKSMPTLCGILNVSSAYLYRCVQEGEMSLRCALKFELITGGEFLWRDLAPSEAKNIDSVTDRAENMTQG